MVVCSAEIILQLTPILYVCFWDFMKNVHLEVQEASLAAANKWGPKKNFSLNFRALIVYLHFNQHTY